MWRDFYTQRVHKTTRHGCMHTYSFVKVHSHMKTPTVLHTVHKTQMHNHYPFLFFFPFVLKRGVRLTDTQINTQMDCNASKTC